MTNNRKLWSASHSCRIAHFCYSYVVLESIRACFSPEYQNVSMYQAAKRCREKAPNQTLGLWLCYSWVPFSRCYEYGQWWRMLIHLVCRIFLSKRIHQFPQSALHRKRKCLANWWQLLGTFPAITYFGDFNHENYAREVGSHERWENMCNKISIYNISICTACIL
jgi:hypothetical protein